MNPAGTPELSVIIPTLNEETALPLLLGDILCQDGLTYEVLVSDGGSNDATCQLASEVLNASRVPYKVVAGAPGRGRQLNRAVQQSRGKWLLFLHADSRLSDRTAFAQAVGSLRDILATDEESRVAARFSLRFDTDDNEPDFGLFLCQAKSRLDEPGCTHGDQGFLLSRNFFEEVGPFREDLPVMEDTWLAEAIRKVGRWELLPIEIRTSARRFKSEGLRERQILNALLVNFLFVGWDVFLQQAPDLYRQQVQTGRLHLQPFWTAIRRQLRQMSLGARFRLWYATGRFVRSQAWQLVFQREARRCFLLGQSSDEVGMQSVRCFRRWFDPLTDHPGGALLAGTLTWCWFFVCAVRWRLQSA